MTRYNSATLFSILYIYTSNYSYSQALCKKKKKRPTPLNFLNIRLVLTELTQTIKEEYLYDPILSYFQLLNDKLSRK